MKNLSFPLKFQFNIGTFANDFTATDAQWETLAYVRQKMFKFKEAVQIYSDKSKTQVDYQISADRWLDFSAAYSLQDAQGKEIGKIVRKGWRSIWRARYELVDQFQQPQFVIKEKSALVKVMDSIFGEIPVLGFFTVYVFNPTYLIINSQEQEVAILKKTPSLFGRNFEVHKTGMLDGDDQERVMLGLMMMILLERKRG